MIQQVVRTALYEEIVKQLILHIKNGVWKPGEQLPSELEFAERFGVSRNCIREALKAMSLSGIIQSRPGQGTFLTKDALYHIANYELIGTLSNNASLYELIEARVVVESQLAGLAAVRADETDKQRISETFEELRSELLNGSSQGVSPNPSEAGMQFHTAVTDAAKNKLLTQFLRSIQGELEAQRARLRLSRRDVTLMLVDHMRIHDAILQNDSEGASRAMAEHLKHTYETILAGQDEKRGRGNAI